MNIQYIIIQLLSGAALRFDANICMRILTVYHIHPKYCDRKDLASDVDPDQMPLKCGVWSESTLFANYPGVFRQ